MQFRPDMIEQVRQGSKSQTRRLLKRGDKAVYEGTGPLRRIVSVYRGGRMLWHVNGVYAMNPGRGKKATSWFGIDAIGRSQRVGDITTKDVRAEGFGSKREFKWRWTALYPSSDMTEPVWVLYIHPTTPQFERAARLIARRFGLSLDRLIFTGRCAPKRQSADRQ